MITSNNRLISRHERFCKTIFSQARGLMFRRRQNLLMLFPSERKVHLHTFFVFYPLAIAVIDENYTVVEIKEDLRPFRFWNSKKKGKYLLELALPGMVPRAGDTIEIKQEE